MKLTGSQIVCQVLLDHGVDTIFGYPGGAALNIFDELYRYKDRINHVLAAHEQGASHAADGYARSTGKTGVVIATSGPGATNLVTGIATAFMDSVPMVAITANVADSLIGRDAFQEICITGITLPVTKHNFFVNDVNDLQETLLEAFRIANSGRKGPVLVDITKDATAAKAEYNYIEPYKLSDLPQASRDEILHIAEMINNSQRPVIYAGGGVVASSSKNLLHDFVCDFQIPLTHTLMAPGILSHDNPLNMGMVGMHGTVAANKAVNEADLVLALGARFSDRVALNPKKFAKNAKIIQVDIDKSEINKNVLVTHHCISDIKSFLTMVRPFIKTKNRTAWANSYNMWKQVPIKVLECNLHPKDILSTLSDMTPNDAIFVTDVGQHQMWAAQYLKHTTNTTFLTSGGLGTMGYGYGAAIGASIGCPDKRVVHITGDGSFHMNLNEACTAVSQNLPLITVIFNNQVLGMVYQWQTMIYGSRYSHTEPERKTDFVKLIEAFGGTGYRVSDLVSLKNAMENALKSNGPVWIECMIPKDLKVLPMIMAGKTVDDIITQ